MTLTAVTAFKLVSLVLISSLLLVEVRAKNLSVLIFLPIHDTNQPKVSWERGLEILPGALAAESGVNANSTVLSGHNLELVVVDSGKRGNGDTVIRQFVEQVIHDTNQNIVGISGFLSYRDLSILSPLVRRKGILMNAFASYTMPGDKVKSRSLHSPSVMVDALLNIVTILNWSRIGIITDSGKDYFFAVAEMFLQQARTKINSTISISQYIELLHITTTAAVSEIMKHNTRILIVSANIENTIQLICLVHELGLTWPEYAWVFHSYVIDDFLNIQTASCDMQNALNGIFLIDDQPPGSPAGRQLISGITFAAYYKEYLSKLTAVGDGISHVVLRPNPYAKIVYDSVWEMAIALNKRYLQACMCTTNFNAFYRWQNDAILRMHYVRNGSSILTGTIYYNSSVPTVKFDMTMLNNTLSDELPVVVADLPLGYAVIVAIQLALTTVFVTFVFLLYVYFHREPEIRATSVTLSLLIFTACYLNLFYLAVLYHSNRSVEIDTKVDDAICLLLLWLSAPGITLPLMLAILIVKMMRVYHIFNNAKLRLGRYCSDLSLAVYVVLILLPDVFVHLIWVSIDRYHSVVDYNVQNGFVHAKKTCGSENQIIWFGLLTVYLFALMFALGVIAVLTRTIRLRHFKDTKKVNVLLFILCYGIVITFSYWLLLLTLNSKRYVRTLPLHLGHSVMVISFQVLLFVPKVFPPLWRCIKDHVYTHTHNK